MRRFRAEGDTAALRELGDGFGCGSEIRPGFACDQGASIRSRSACFTNFRW
jgi:hypothetical protein